MYKKDDYVVIKHPDYPELEGLAKVTNDSRKNIVNIEFCDGKGGFLAHVDYIRHATEEEKQGFE